MSVRRMLMPMAVLAVLIGTTMHAAQNTKGGGAAKDNSDIELVEKLLIARRDYQRTLELLRAHYINTSDQERAKWAEDELREFHRMNHQAYRLDLDVPPPTLQATAPIKEANDLVLQAKQYKDKGMGSDYIDNQRRAELLLQRVLTVYPTSDKIGEVAYLLGDLYEGKAYKQYRRAAMYFERSFQWNPTTPLDGRLRAARIYDKQVPERGRAIELYKEIQHHDTDPKRREEADKRLKALQGTK
jgi:tetratricopeptide (TPR) repeat protein